MLYPGGGGDPVPARAQLEQPPERKSKRMCSFSSAWFIQQYLHVGYTDLSVFLLNSDHKILKKCNTENRENLVHTS